MTGNTDKDFRPCGPGRLLRRLSTWPQDRRPLLSLTGERGLLLIINRFISQAKFLINMGKNLPKNGPSIEVNDDGVQLKKIEGT